MELGPGDSATRWQGRCRGFEALRRTDQQDLAISRLAAGRGRAGREQLFAIGEANVQDEMPQRHVPDVRCTPETSRLHATIAVC